MTSTLQLKSLFPFLSFLVHPKYSLLDFYLAHSIVVTQKKPFSLLKPLLLSILIIGESIVANLIFDPLLDLPQVFPT